MPIITIRELSRKSRKERVRRLRRLKKSIHANQYDICTSLVAQCLIREALWDRISRHGEQLEL